MKNNSNLFLLENFKSLRGKSKLILIFILCILVFIFYSNQASCTEAYSSLDASLIQQHRARIDIIFGLIEEGDDEILSEIYKELISLKQENLTIKHEPFSDSEPFVPNYSVYSLKMILRITLFFFLLSLFGCIFIKLPFLLSPVIDYEEEIFNILCLFDDNPEAYYELFLTCFNKLVSKGIIQE